MPVLIKPYMPAPALTRELGKIVIRHGQVDHLLRLTIKSLLGISITDPLYKHETHKKRSSVLRERIRELARGRLAAHKAVLDELIAQIDSIERLTNLRNIIAHGVWSRVTTGGLAKLRDPQDDKLHPLPTVKQLKVAEREMYALYLALNHSRRKGRLKQAL